MTTSRERVIRSLRHQPIDRAPRELWVSAGLLKDRPDDVAEIRYRFPPDIEAPDVPSSVDANDAVRSADSGAYTDAWGCHWRVDAPGAEGIPVAPPLAEKSHIAGYRPPFELLDPGRLARVNQGCAVSNRFVLASTETRPAERVRLLRGPEAAESDLAHGDRAIRGLIARVHDFSRREMELWARSDADGVAFADDLSWGQGAAWASEAWREMFKPLYRDYCQILRAADKFVFLSLRGDVREVLPDLVGLGIDALECDLGLMCVEQLAADFRGQITFWGGVAADALSARAEQAREAVTRVRSALDFGRGGVIARCRWRPGMPLRNVAAMLDQWSQPLGMHTRTNA
jgi:hypothetical protein